MFLYVTSHHSSALKPSMISYCIRVKYSSIYPSICPSILPPTHPLFIHSLICLSNHPPIHSSIHLYLSTYPSTHPYLSTYPSTHPFFHLPTHLSLCSPNCLPTHPSVHLLNYLSVHPSIRSSLHPSTHPTIHLPIHPPTHPCTHSSIYPPIQSLTHLSIHSSIYLLICPSTHSPIIHPLTHPSVMHPFNEYLLSPGLEMWRYISLYQGILRRREAVTMLIVLDVRMINFMNKKVMRVREAHTLPLLTCRTWLSQFLPWASVSSSLQWG